MILSDRVLAQNHLDWVRKRCLMDGNVLLNTSRCSGSVCRHRLNTGLWLYVSIRLQGGDDGADCSFKGPTLLLPINTWRSAPRSKRFSRVRLAVCRIKGSWAWQKPDTEVDDVWNHVALFNFSSHSHAAGLHHHVPPETRRRHRQYRLLTDSKMSHVIKGWHHDLDLLLRVF